MKLGIPLHSSEILTHAPSLNLPSPCSHTCSIKPPSACRTGKVGCSSAQAPNRHPRIRHRISIHFQGQGRVYNQAALTVVREHIPSLSFSPHPHQCYRHHTAALMKTRSRSVRRICTRKVPCSFERCKVCGGWGSVHSSAEVRGGSGPSESFSLPIISRNRQRRVASVPPRSPHVFSAVGNLEPEDHHPPALCLQERRGERERERIEES